MYTAYRVHKRCTQEPVYSRGWEDMGVVVKLEEWTLVVVNLADNAGVALADGVNAVIPDRLNENPMAMVQHSIFSSSLKIH